MPTHTYGVLPRGPATRVIRARSPLMPDPASTETLIKLAAAAVALATAALTLVTVITQSRKRKDSATDPAQPPTTTLPPGDQPAADPVAEPVLPGRPVFINREREMKDLISRVHAGNDNVLTIEGTRWVGKSATATELVHCLRSGPAKGTFDPRARRFVWFDARDACPSLADLCQYLSLQTDDQSLSTTADAEKRDRLRIHLAGNKTVLILDNLSLSDDPESRALIDFLDDLPNGSLVIAAVNRPGRLVAPRVPLRDLDAASVHKLIEDRARRLNLDGLEQFDRAFASRLHGLIGGNPGVIEWFLRGYRDSSESLAERVEAVERGGKLSDVFGPTWDALGDDCKCALEACAYLRGEATARQFSIACDRPEDEMRAAAEHLRREGLLNPVRGEGRPTVYTCAPAFQLFVASETLESSRATFTTRLAEHYVGYFAANPEDARYGASEVGALRVVREELSDADDDARIQALFRATLDILFTLGQFDELIAAAHLAFDSAHRIDNFAGAAVAGAIKAATHAIRGETALAEDAFANASVAAANSGLPSPIARVMRCRGFLHYRSREPLEALAAIDGAEQLARDADDGVTLVDTLDLRTAANWYLGRFDACEAAARASLEAGAQLHWERARAYPLRYLAEIAIQRDQPAAASALIEEARDIAARFGDRRQLARVDLTRARICLLEGMLETGEAAVTRAVAEATRLGLPAERQEAAALATAISRAQRSFVWRRTYAARRPKRFSDAPVGGD